MSKYFTRLYREMWDDPDFVSMSEAGQNVFMYLISTPIGSQFGIFKAGVASLAESKRCEIKTFRKGFKEVLQNGFVKHCESTLLVWIPSYVKRNPPGNLKVIMGWGKAWNQLPDCELKRESYFGILESIRDFKPDWVPTFESSFKRPTESSTESPSEYNVQGSGFRVQGSEPPIPPKGELWRESDFEIFHSAYHAAGKSRGPAFKAWKVAIKEKRLPDLGTLLESVEHHKNSKRWNDGKVLGEAVFLNQSRWEQRLEQVGEENRPRQEKQQSREYNYPPPASEIEQEWMK